MSDIMDKINAWQGAKPTTEEAEAALLEAEATVDTLRAFLGRKRRGRKSKVEGEEGKKKKPIVKK